MQNKLTLTIMSILSIFLLSIYLISCSESNAAENKNSFTYATLSIDFNDESFTFKNLRIYPIKAKENFNEQQKNYGNYTSLESALKEEKIEISEKSINGNSDEVNKLFVENKSKDTIVLLSGEIVKGGKQDRTLSDDIVLLPGKGKIDLDVFCVEQGRWIEKENNQVAGKPMEEKKFKMSTTIVKPSVRKNAMIAKEQSKVWDKVEEVNVKANNTTETSAYTAFDENIDYQKQEKEYLDFYKSKLKNNNSIIGVVAVSGDKVIGCDIFATRNLFENAWTKLLSSYVNEAIYDGSVVTISSAEVKKYCDKLLSTEISQADYLKANGKLYKNDSRVMHLISY